MGSDMSAPLGYTMPQSPLTSGSCDLVKTLQASHVAKLYHDEYGIDVMPYLDASEISLLRCHQTGYEFFYPFSLAGPPAFYADLYSDEKNEAWAYQTTKWEYAAAAAYVSEGDKLLDIGCGGGDFLLYIDTMADPIGLESSPFALESVQAKGMKAIAQSIQDHTKQHSGVYDVVVAFQVLEHVAEVHSFLEAALEVLAPGGCLIIAVPNNDSFVGGEADLTLNLPPHHMGRWGRDSLRSLAQVFDLDMISIEFEPLQSHNKGWYQAVMERKYLPEARWKRTLFYRLGFNQMFNAFLKDQGGTILGHTIMAVFRKK